MSRLDAEFQSFQTKLSRHRQVLQGQRDRERALMNEAGEFLTLVVRAQFRAIFERLKPTLTGEEGTVRERGNALEVENRLHIDPNVSILIVLQIDAVERCVYLMKAEELSTPSKRLLGYSFDKIRMNHDIIEDIVADALKSCATLFKK